MFYAYIAQVDNAIGLFYSPSRIRYRLNTRRNGVNLDAYGWAMDRCFYSSGSVLLRLLVYEYVSFHHILGIAPFDGSSAL